MPDEFDFDDEPTRPARRSDRESGIRWYHVTGTAGLVLIVLVVTFFGGWYVGHTVGFRQGRDAGASEERLRGQISDADRLIRDSKRLMGP